MTAVVQYQTGPPHYTEGTLLSALDHHGIGRPSTYAGIISKILARKYVALEPPTDENDLPQIQYAIDHPDHLLTKKVTQRKPPSKQPVLQITDLGRACIAFLVDHYPQIVDYQFTAQMETRLDQISEGTLDWKTVVSEYYQRLSEIAPRQFATNKPSVGQLAGLEVHICSGSNGEYARCGPHTWSLDSSPEESRPSITISDVLDCPAYQWTDKRTVWRAVIRDGQYGKYWDIRKHAPSNKDQKAVRAHDHRVTAIGNAMTLQQVQAASIAKCSMGSNTPQSGRGGRGSGNSRGSRAKRGSRGGRGGRGGHIRRGAQ